MLTIGVTTFKYRYQKYFKPLLSSLTTLTDSEIFIAINGEHNEKFDNHYRRDILKDISEHDNVYPIIYPVFRGLTKLWNNIIINATSDYVLLLNDDVTITANNFFTHINHCISEYQTSFKINGSWSHVVLKKSEVEQLNYFDERLLGIGEEEIFEWHYNDRFNRGFLNVNIPGIVNHVDMTHAPTNIVAGASGKYSKFNRDFLFNNMFTIDEKNGKSYGMINEKLIYNGSVKQYPYEEFYKANKDKL